ncbi:hypothetical protein OL239_11810 [Arthrobacter sp. ATA002]|uniref:hypothetical protein n=1 Tax=Arthrobacter sp. ATA002 TaxID=2991715 RepID=UPI0022A722B9|nr:hypothetical protein [Arthrobacter sp. ATA002]WAP50709.1 hypothetical protein OL239_11810 [Arthrobacter sp. ATA002]
MPTEWLLRAHPAILMVSALVLYHQFVPLPASPMGLVSELFVLSTAFSLLSGRGRKASKTRGPAAGGSAASQDGPERPAE